MARLVITGGAGYVGAHASRAARAAGHDVVVLDDLTGGYRAAVPGRLVVADLRDASAVRAVLAEGADAVLHFAARMNVRESFLDPEGYRDVNVRGTEVLLDAMHATGVRHLVVSSTCAVYGVPSRVPLDEALPWAPISPYGATKAAMEARVVEAEAQGRLTAVRLRYFNAAGAADDGSLGEAHDPETHLVPLALDAATGGAPLTVFGTNHPTPDGTCVRDYVHVDDLAAAHLAALDRLLAGRPGGAWNLGTGTGASVRQVVATVESVTGRPVAHGWGAARDGDPPVLVADPRRAHADLGWQARHGLRRIVEDAWRWHLAPRYGPRASR
jgi:UDP-glucose-4-epimerase GalE